MIMSNLYVDWKRGFNDFPKVYMIRIYYSFQESVINTCLKLGFTSQYLHQRAINLLGAMKRATGLNISGYEIVSILYSNNYSQIEYALHYQAEHLFFYDDFRDRISFPGFTEILSDTDHNLELIYNPTVSYSKGHSVIPYYPKSDSNDPSEFEYNNFRHVHIAPVDYYR